MKKKTLFLLVALALSLAAGAEAAVRTSSTTGDRVKLVSENIIDIDGHEYKLTASNRTELSESAALLEALKKLQPKLAGDCQVDYEWDEGANPTLRDLVFPDACLRRELRGKRSDIEKVSGDEVVVNGETFGLADDDVAKKILEFLADFDTDPDDEDPEWSALTELSGVGLPRGSYFYFFDEFHQ